MPPCRVASNPRRQPPPTPWPPVPLRWPRGRPSTASSVRRAMVLPARAAASRPGAEHRHVHARQRRRRSVSSDPVRRARDPDAAICRFERYADLAARRLSPQPSVHRRPRSPRAPRPACPERSRGAMPPPAKRCSSAGPPARAVTKSTRAAGSSGRTCRTPDDSPPAVLRQKIVNPNARSRAGGRGGGRGGATPATAIVKTPDGREIRGVRRNEDTFSLQMVDAGRTAADVRQAAAVIGRDRQHVAAPAGLRHPLVGRRDREPRRVSAHAAGARPEQDRVRAAGSRRCHLRAAPRGGNRASQLADVLGRLPGHALFRADAHQHDERGPGFEPRGRRRCPATTPARARRSSSTA